MVEYIFSKFSHFFKVIEDELFAKRNKMIRFTTEKNMFEQSVE
jgi:hypothetical protein